MSKQQRQVLRISVCITSKWMSPTKRSRKQCYLVEIPRELWAILAGRYLGAPKFVSSSKEPRVRGSLLRTSNVEVHLGRCYPISSSVYHPSGSRNTLPGYRRSRQYDYAIVSRPRERRHQTQHRPRSPPLLLLCSHSCILRPKFGYRIAQRLLLGGVTYSLPPDTHDVELRRS